MKHRVLLSILLFLIMSLTACSHQAPVSDAVSTETPSANHTENIPEKEEAPVAPVEQEPQVVDTQTEEKQEEQTQLPAEEPATEVSSESEEDSEKEPEEEENAGEGIEDVISAYEKMLEDENLSLEQRDVLERYINYLKESAGMVDSEAEIPPVTEDYAYTEGYVPPVQRTDEEVKTALTNYVDNFKNTSTFANLTGVAAERIDELLDIVKNNPESNKTLRRYITFYKNGSYTEEDFLYMVERWIEVGGPFGSRVIVSE